MVKSLIPVGKSLGPFIKDGEIKSFNVHLGPGYEELGVYQFATWNLAHEDPEAQLACHFDRAALKALMDESKESRSHSDVDRDIDKLIELNCMVEIDLNNDPLESFLSEHIFMPMGRCYGNVGDDLELFGIGHTEPAIWVPRWTQVIWSASHRDGPIWNACAEIADRVPGATPKDVAANFAESLPALLAIYCGYLEVK